MLAAFALLTVMTDPTPLTRAHAHNDYEHARPLEDALEQGFSSVEADIYLVEGELRVGHDRKDLVAGRTLEKLYLDPLLERVKARKGHVYQKAERFTLLVDIKADGEAIYAELRTRLPKYRAMLSEYANGRRRSGAVDIVLSGDRPVKKLVADKRRCMWLDGRLDDDYAGERPSAIAPLVSSSFSPLFSWRGVGPMSDTDRTKLTDIVSKAHRQGQQVRFWGAPDKLAAWQLLYNAGVDLINTDDLKGLASYLRSRS
ncbi:secreted protein [Fimbriimonas ginsengisoli Gsoil 348]|uniref:Altered inheritance of mitochondria protein 6 n=1 Tax=Fimbriimonas ginsengisoli Gsoil 348 TaxID=661478 RepID=A0A068NVK4_FIMGI|nr:phosphatidylinositol-specific phospholipase C/glycerophosphodiester phosphodiesterase family protein [Fimbriimonas ginsengisoli]AIE85599.1 secreted protein [Fimbriimonas ginsengisoli Gsoil 348]